MLYVNCWARASKHSNTGTSDREFFMRTHQTIPVQTIANLARLKKEAAAKSTIDTRNAMVWAALTGGMNADDPETLGAR
eukprot:2533628-Lingulodinium_polyedra.AAC.1